MAKRRRSSKEEASGVTIKVSASLYAAVKESAERNHRSVPKQMEYWSEMGRVLDEVGVSKADLLQAANVARLRYRNVPSRAVELFQDLRSFFETPPPDAQEEFTSLIEAEKGPIYGASADFPGKTIRRLPDGTEALGTFQDGSFVPEVEIASAGIAEAGSPRRRYARAGR